ncbi:hypothetical protein HPB52_024773 [Rhipicephalus sanguineus]|uniref:Uncharacterized protein n=1 Tax=Rhipicephalus sanguineus TaxID=34632 RepID=A0A9D4YRU9_RHISA|nr:hypothetical protein HPB52_024773 [Rhipicephalus sanguineus]
MSLAEPDAQLTLGTTMPQGQADPPNIGRNSHTADAPVTQSLRCACPGLAQERSRVTTAYRRQGLPASTLEHLLFPSRPLPALRSLVEFLDETGIAAYR